MRYQTEPQGCGDDALRSVVGKQSFTEEPTLVADARSRTDEQLLLELLRFTCPHHFFLFCVWYSQNYMQAGLPLLRVWPLTSQPAHQKTSTVRKNLFAICVPAIRCHKTLHTAPLSKMFFKIILAFWILLQHFFFPPRWKEPSVLWTKCLFKSLFSCQISWAAEIICDLQIGFKFHVFGICALLKRRRGTQCVPTIWCGSGRPFQPATYSSNWRATGFSFLFILATRLWPVAP